MEYFQFQYLFFLLMVRLLFASRYMLQYDDRVTSTTDNLNIIETLWKLHILNEQLQV